MAKTMSREATSSSSNGSKKERKKLARQEAKTMLKLAQAKKDEQKAEKMLAKVQAQLEASRTHIHTIEGKLAEMRNADHRPEAEASDTGLNGQSEQGGQAEGRTDIDSEGQEDASPERESEMENTQAESGSENEDSTDGGQKSIEEQAS